MQLIVISIIYATCHVAVIVSQYCAGTSANVDVSLWLARQSSVELCDAWNYFSELLAVKAALRRISSTLAGIDVANSMSLQLMKALT